MKFIHKVHFIEVKRAFIVAEKVRFWKKGRRTWPKLRHEYFLKRLNIVKQAVLKLTEKQLNKGIVGKKREIAYNDANWRVAIASPDELGVWRRAGGLPPAWTCCSLKETARYVKRGIEKNSKKIRARSRKAIPRMLGFTDVFMKEKYLFPIVFQSGTGTKGRLWCKKKVKGDIDDGCMRSIALVIKGYKNLKIYFGVPKVS